MTRTLVTHEQTLESKIHGYQASKTFAERIAWDFIESQNETGSTLLLVTICPPMVLGPVHPTTSITAAHPNESSAQLLNATNTPANESAPIRRPVFADVRDGGKVHVRRFGSRKGAFQC
ncbi:hypothetical protein DM02DRAFT_663680 [Periconia macrospinosa]|uniref:NAD-dependent epimerase/dehydratase domain-containing protein n=1 Tax=Periconia macrospinosa TaxID=97972 RepID=A0A2V1D3B2_9PLEO|nr:hypothetical protein DM02DRAFT_663680 [Periconia macrospinosa]